MTVIAAGSFRGSPGATTLAVALATAWAAAGRHPLVVEADPDGGVLAARHGLGHHPCLTDLAVRARGAIEPNAIWEHTQTSSTGVPVLVGHPSADQCQATLRTGAAPIAALLDGLADHDVVVDVGRVRPHSPAQPLIDAAQLVVIVLRPRLEDVDGAAARLAAFGRGDDVRLVLAGDRPYGAGEIAEVLGVTVVGVVPSDERGVRALMDDGRRAPRLPFHRAVANLARVLDAEMNRVRPL